jgi:hypothetical protein
MREGMRSSPMSRSPSSWILPLLTVAWIAVAATYPSCHRGLSSGPLGPKESACVLRLPKLGPLRLLLEKGTVVTLAVSPPGGQPPPSAPELQAAEPTLALPAGYSPVTDVRVLDQTCLPEQEQPNCYAVLAVPDSEVGRLMSSSGSVWIWIQPRPSPPPGAIPKSTTASTTKP